MFQKHFLIGAVFIVFLIVIGLFEEKPEVGSSSLQKGSYQGSAMGTSFSVVYFYDEQLSNQIIKGEIDQAIQLVDNQMSTYKPDSALSIFNKKPANSCYQFPVESYFVISMAQDISRLTNGAFDITVGPLVNLWGFGAEYSDQEEPTELQIEELKSKRVGYESLTLKENNTICKTKNVYLDLSAIAKGYAVDLVAESLDKLSIGSYLVEIGGELKAKGLKPSRDYWRVAVEEPSSELARSVHKVVELKNMGIATSGDYRNYFERDGQRFSHTINPNTGKPITHNLASISVLHDSVAYADAMATALNVLGPEQAMLLARSEKLSVYMLVKADQGFKAQSTKSFQLFILD